jgi:hypothetical protein
VWTGELLNAAGETISKRLLSILENVRKNIIMPEDWKKPKYPRRVTSLKMTTGEVYHYPPFQEKSSAGLKEMKHKGVEKPLRSEQEAYTK